MFVLMQVLGAGLAVAAVAVLYPDATEVAEAVADIDQATLSP
jgi:hypothetical protein